MASHEIRVRMRQKNVSEFEPIFCEISQVPVYIPFRIDYDSFKSRSDDVRSVCESRDKESFNLHWTSNRVSPEVAETAQTHRARSYAFSTGTRTILPHSVQDPS